MDFITNGCPANAYCLGVCGVNAQCPEIYYNESVVGVSDVGMKTMFDVFNVRVSAV